MGSEWQKFAIRNSTRTSISHLEHHRAFFAQSKKKPSMLWNHPNAAMHPIFQDIFRLCILSRKPLKESNTSVFRPMDAFSDLLNKIRRSLALKTVTFFHLDLILSANLYFIRNGTINTRLFAVLTRPSSSSTHYSKSPNFVQKSSTRWKSTAF